MQQSIMALTAFWVLVFFMLDRILPASAYPISVSQIPQSSIISRSAFDGTPALFFFLFFFCFIFLCVFLAAESLKLIQFFPC